MLLDTKAIVLHTVKFGDSQIIIDTLTERMGRLSFICRIPKTKKAKIKKQLFQTLNILNISFDFRQTAGLQHIKQVNIALPFTSILADPIKISLSMFIAEFLYYSTREEQQNVALYNYIETGLLWLDNSIASYSNFHLVFMMRLSHFLGVFPNLTSYRKGDYFDIRDGTFSSQPPLHQDVLTIDESNRINILIRMNFDTMHLFAMSRNERNQCAELILKYYKLHIPNFPTMKSLSVLQELFV